ncbi:MAG: MptD family putative ECF transporter S component, partial [Deltaproteobacteria bacterium]|nr:MptD family putative ECF transporter S component [Deltaproteobacteria bacterium]
VLSSLLPIYFSWDSYIEASKASGFSLSYAMLYKDFYTDYRIVALVILLNTTGGFLGALLGIKLFKKHFLPLGS